MPVSEVSRSLALPTSKSWCTLAWWSFISGPLWASGRAGGVHGAWTCCQGRQLLDVGLPGDSHRLCFEFCAVSNVMRRRRVLVSPASLRDESDVKFQGSVVDTTRSGSPPVSGRDRSGSWQGGGARGCADFSRLNLVLGSGRDGSVAHRKGNIKGILPGMAEVIIWLGPAPFNQARDA